MIELNFLGTESGLWVATKNPVHALDFFHYKFLWDPSQIAPFEECLHPHQATLFSSVISTISGENPVPLCEPSQKGSLELNPHVQKALFPIFSLIT